MSDATKTETVIDSSLEPPVLIKLRERQIRREISLRGYVGHLLQQCHRWNTAHRYLGRYSIDKLLAFDEYQRTTSWSRVAAVLVLTPIPSLLLLFATAAVQHYPVHYGLSDEPLVYAVHLGWHLTFLCAAQLLIMRHALEWTQSMYQHWLVVVVALLCALSTQGVLLLVLELIWQIPVRYRGAVSFPVYCLWFVLYHVLLKRKLLLQYRQQILAYLPLLGCQVFALVVFGLVGIVFKRINTAGQLILSLAFPVFKAVLKRLVSHYAHSLGDISSAVTVCAVEITGSLFENVCLQSVRSLGIALLLVLIGLVQLVLGTQLYTHQSFIVDGRLVMTTAVTIVESALFPGVRSSTRRQKNGAFRHGATFTQAFRKSSSVYLAPEKPQTHVTFTRTKSHVKVAAVNSGSVRRLSLLDLHTIDNTFISEMQSESEPQQQQSPARADRFKRKISIDCITLSHKELAWLLTQTLQLLFLSEVLIVCEYIGCIMPFQYALYSLVVSSADPNTLAGETYTGSLQQALATSCVYGLLKTTSLLLIVQLIRRKYGLSALHLLAFVLEKYAVSMQGKLIACFLVMARLRNAHT